MFLPPAQFAAHFVAAGWSENRTVTPDARVPREHPAWELLSSFDGIHITPTTDSGVECATSDIAFRFLADRCNVVSDWESRLGTVLIGVALTSKKYGHLWIAQDGRFFSSNDVTDSFSFVADDFHDCVKNFLTGVWHKPLLAPGETTAMIYGVNLTLGDDRIYDWVDTSRHRNGG